MKKLEFNQKSSGQSRDVQRDVSNWTGKPETRFAKYVWQERRILGEKPLRCVALRCVALQRVKSGDQLLALANFAAGAKRRAKREGSTGIR